MRTRDPHIVVGVGLMTPNRLKNVSIVVVEDDDDTRMYLFVFLDHLGAKRRGRGK